MDVQLLKEVKKKLDYDENRRKLSRENIETCSQQITHIAPKTVSPDHKPISQKFLQHSEFHKNILNNSIASKLNYVNFNNFFDFQEKNKAKNKDRDIRDRARIGSFHKKNANEINPLINIKFPIKQNLNNDSPNIKADIWNDNAKYLMKEMTHLNYQKNLENHVNINNEKSQENGKNNEIRIGSEPKTMKKSFIFKKKKEYFLKN